MMANQVAQRRYGPARAQVVREWVVKQSETFERRDVAGRFAIGEVHAGQILGRLVKAGLIRRVSLGVYERVRK